MTAAQPTVLIMAAGTGGHIYPALAIARVLQQRSARVEWLGTMQGMENDLLADSEMKLHRISVQGLRGSGWLRKLLAPFMLLRAFLQSLQVVRQVNPDCVLGMGGYVCGPAGVAARLLGKPLLIHEQNSVAGFTNRLLAALANRIMEGFPATFAPAERVVFTGNPVRAEIAELGRQGREPRSPGAALHLLVLGGSQGAAAINRVIPEVLANWQDQPVPRVWHQTGRRTLAQTLELYESMGLSLSDELRVQAYIDDMAAAYAWADIAVCRAGASTVSEVASAGLPAVFVPYPHHRDQQQTGNARWLVEQDAACLLQESELSSRQLLLTLRGLDQDRTRLQEMGARARRLAPQQAAEKIATECMEFAGA